MSALLNRPSSSSSPRASMLASPERHVLTVTLEDYFQAQTFRGVIGPADWYRFESRLQRGAEQVLEMLAEAKVHATFFVTPWNAGQHSDLIQEIRRQGHEIGCGLDVSHWCAVAQWERLSDEIRMARESLEQILGHRVQGFRGTDTGELHDEHGLLNVLSEHGFVYDCSPTRPGWQNLTTPWRRFCHHERTNGGTIWKVPPATLRCGGYTWSLSGRQQLQTLARPWMRSLPAMWLRRHAAPFVMSLHSWEFDPGQPRITAGDSRQLRRHYFQLAQTGANFRSCLSQLAFESVAEHFRLPQSSSVPTAPEPTHPATLPWYTQSHRLSQLRPVPRQQVTVLVPCYNEASSLPYLAKTLDRVSAELSRTCDVDWIFIDDGSTDATPEILQVIFGEHLNCRIIRHATNRGLGAAIRTGLIEARTEIVCSIDCDGSYDPHELLRMIPLLTDDVDLVTGSPYHVEGQVLNVPAWRLWLARQAAGMYRAVLGLNLQSFTSCLRVYRRSRMLTLPLQEERFLGTAELLGQLALQGGRIVEQPVILARRVFGQSKMKVIRTMLGHLGLLARLQLARWQSDRLSSTNPLPPHSTRRAGISQATDVSLSQSDRRLKELDQQVGHNFAVAESQESSTARPETRRVATTFPQSLLASDK